jgi:signal transduction histidine kinase
VEGRVTVGLLRGEWTVGPALAVLGLVVLTVGLVWRPFLLPGASAPELLVVQLDALALAFSLVLGVLCWLWWRLAGEPALLWVALAVMLHGTVTLGIAPMWTELTVSDDLLWLGIASRVVALGLAVLAIRAPVLDDGRHLPVDVLVARVLALTVALTLALTLVPGLGPLVGQADPTAPGGLADQLWFGLVLGGAWLVLGAWAIRRSADQNRELLVWAGLLFLTFGLSRLLRVLPTDLAHVGRAAPKLLRLYGLVVVTAGVGTALVAAYRRQSHALLVALTSELAAEARIEAEHHASAERSHEARNALTAIEAATLTLREHQHSLDDELRHALVDGVSMEIHRLQSLISAGERPGELSRFRATEAIAAIVTSARFQGSVVTVDVPDDLVAIGSPADTTQVLHNLFQNARRYGGGVFTVAATLEDGHVVIRVRDDGPGVAPEDRARVFERGWRAPWAARDVDGDGLGLFVAERLMREQGGALRLEEDTAGEGACFSVVLPGFSESLDAAHPDAPVVVAFRSGRTHHDATLGQDDAGEARTSEVGA